MCLLFFIDRKNTQFALGLSAASVVPRKYNYWRKARLMKALTCRHHSYPCERYTVHAPSKTEGHFDKCARQLSRHTPRLNPRRGPRRVPWHVAWKAPRQVSRHCAWQASLHTPRLHPRQVLRRVPHGSTMCAATLTAALGVAFVATLAAVLAPELTVAIPADLSAGLAAELAVDIAMACRGVLRALPRRAASLVVSFGGLPWRSPRALPRQSCRVMSWHVSRHTATCTSKSKKSPKMYIPVI